ncbi:hypothetical protein [Parapedobacter sp. 10938]|uniref:hypothetical protein n=1 Tax=Parapedobacter flavus TaxID=3110225 RepID=UPI002DB9D1D1|nr:hypothetical protein [Parapedobacter sp. 10938]MEC3881401.1 hypothetical protein [Parapedobacter sp. 10938]
MDMLFPEDYDQYDEEGEQLRGFGVRLNPEWRYYTSRTARNNMTSFFIGAGPLLKTMRIQEAEWRWKQNGTSDMRSAWSLRLPMDSGLHKIG